MLPIASGILTQAWKAIGHSADANHQSVGQPLAIFPLIAAENDSPPDELIHLRLSHEFLNQRVQRAISKHSIVQDTILGTDIAGWATTTGNTGLSLEPSNDRGVLKIAFTGTIHSQTIGSNGPAVVHSRGETWFHAHSYLKLSERGIDITPAQATARTITTTTGVGARVSGLRGRIVERVALRRSLELRSKAERIAAAKAEAQVAAALDEELHRAVIGIRQSLVDNVRKLGVDTANEPTVHFRSSNDSLYVVMRRGGVPVDGLRTSPPGMVGDAHVSLWIHRTLVRQALSNPEWSGALQPLLDGMIASSPRESALEKPSEIDFRWSEGRDWLVIEYRPDSPAPSRIAARN